MTAIQSVTFEGPDPTTAHAFYTTAFGLGAQVGVGHSETPTTGFRGFTMSLVVSQPSTVDSFIGTALDSGATPLKPVAKSFWGYGGAVRAPDGVIWTVATSAKKDSGPATRRIDDIVLLLGVADVKASKRFYVDHGLTVARSFGSKYVEFASQASHTKLALYGRRALAKTAGVSPDGTGSHRIVIGSDAGPFTDPDGFAWGHTHDYPQTYERAQREPVTTPQTDARGRTETASTPQTDARGRPETASTPHSDSRGRPETASTPHSV